MEQEQRNEHGIFTGPKSYSRDKMQIIVSDTGKGIPQSVIEALTEMDGQTVYGEQKPHIMGLRIVKQIVSAHGGDFEIADNGHRVALTLPVQAESHL